MSTKAIREALEQLKVNGGNSAQAYLPEARAELEAIEKACLLLYQIGVVHNELGEEHEATSDLDAAADHLMKIGEELAS